MKKRFCCFVVVAAALCLGQARAERVTGVAVVVTDSVITEGEILNDLMEVAPAVRISFPNDPERRAQELKKIKDNSIERRVDEKLILHDFVTSGYLTNVLESFIDDQIQRTIRRDYGGDYARFIKTQMAGGTNYEMYRRHQRELFIIGNQSWQNRSNPHKIIISPLRIEQYYQTNKAEFKVEDQVKVRMIVIPQSADDAPGTAKKIAQEILAKINSGVSFAEMARVNSAGSQRAEGGDRGWVDHSVLNPALTQAAFSLKPGQCSGVVEQSEACYLLQVDDVRSAHVKDLKEVRREIELTLTREDNRRLHDLWIERLRKKYYVEYY